MRWRSSRTSRSLEFGGAMDGGADILISSAATDVEAHDFIDIGVGWLRRFGEEGGDGHDLARLAVAALRDVSLNPGLLDGVEAVGGEAFNGGDVFALKAGDLYGAGAHRGSVDVDGAGAADGHAAAELGAGEAEGVAQNPEERCFGIDVNGLRFAVEVEGDVWHGVDSAFQGIRNWETRLATDEHR